MSTSPACSRTRSCSRPDPQHEERRARPNSACPFRPLKEEKGRRASIGAVDAFLLHIDADGDVDFATRAGGGRADFSFAVDATQDGLMWAFSLCGTLQADVDDVTPIDSNGSDDAALLFLTIE